MTRLWTSMVARLPFWRLMLYGAAASLLFFAGSLALGLSQGRVWPTLSLIGTSIVLEAQPAAAASIPLGFDPSTGAGIAILANMIAVPILMVGFREAMHRFRFVRKRMEKAEAVSRKYAKYGVWILAPLCPLLGAYACLAIGSVLRWNPLRVLGAVVVGMVASAFIIAYGGSVLLRWVHL
ncbi:small multi-drug export protein [Alicyclobacillus sendaiensis]|uniref:Small multi-drug export protein n=1 Tax=Alicyclobacillus sendaiensis PA2 TaxID=3029425 RepID=A0ABT6XWM9_ALISE|nr:small multi-drug export protein [Alicyclobacillus sendaiensis]MDI9259498.1 small multi-drug export protein [Alicyclobacillus sendaiensis PA2]